jgi:DNA repair exonuclease SbcCD ATPase subunit
LSNISSIRNRKASADPGRDRLRSAIAAQAEAAAAVARQEAAIREMITARNTARAAAEAAKEEIAAAKEAAADAIATSAARGSTSPGTSGIRRARNAEQDSLDAAEARTSALAKLRESLPELRRSEMLAAREVEACICELFVDPAEKLLAEALALRARLDPIISVLSSLFASGIGMLPTEYGTHADVRGGLDQVHQQMIPLYAGPAAPIPDGGPWKTALAALLADPDTPLDLARMLDSAAES